MKNINAQLWFKLDYIWGEILSSTRPKSSHDRKINILSNLLNFNRITNLTITSQLRKDIEKI